MLWNYINVPTFSFDLYLIDLGYFINLFVYILIFLLILFPAVYNKFKIFNFKFVIVVLRNWFTVILVLFGSFWICIFNLVTPIPFVE